MNDVLKCLLYFALIGFAFFIIGRVMPKELFSFEKFPFRSFYAEREGKIYQRIGVHKWKDSFPDMSRFFPFLMPSKKLSKAITADWLELMLALCTTGLENYTVSLGIGKWITSVTMTIFYVLLYYVWRQR